MLDCWREPYLIPGYIRAEDTARDTTDSLAVRQGGLHFQHAVHVTKQIACWLLVCLLVDLSL